MTLCCIPADLVICPCPEIYDPQSAVSFNCSNSRCQLSGMIHQSCFFKWENMIARFLSSEKNLNNQDMMYVKSILWTREMWNLPIPESMTKCNCGSGVLQRKVIEDIDSNGTESVEVESLNSGRGRVKTFENCEMNWKTVTRSRNNSKRKSNSSVNDSCNKIRKGRSIKVSVSESKVGHESVEEKKKNNKLFRCMTCTTEHPNVLDFNEHCKSGEHKDASNSSEKLSRDVE